jgi:uncharacterized protein (DUF427 family)
MDENTSGEVRIETLSKRVRTYLGGELVADTSRPALVWETYYPVYYLPREDVCAELVPTGDTEPSARLGDAALFDVRTRRFVARRAARRHPTSSIEQLRGLVKIDWPAMGEWFEEDEPVYFAPRDPYRRVDIFASSRHVVLRLDGETVADTVRPRVLLEALPGLAPRYYLPLVDVRMDLLRSSSRTSRCPYKGTAEYWSLETTIALHEDIAWIYRTPFADAAKIAGMVCFYNERIDTYLDDVLQVRPENPFDDPIARLG